MTQVIVTFVLDKAEIVKLSTLTPTLTTSSTVEDVGKLTYADMLEIITQHVGVLRDKAQTIKVAG